MRGWLFLAVLVLLPTTQAMGVPDAVEWLNGQDGALVVEAVAAAGHDPLSWPPGDPVWARLDVPAPDPQDPSEWLREAHAAAAAGYGPGVLPGRDLAAELAGQADAARNASVGVQAFHLLTHHALGGADRDVAGIADALAAAQHDDGGWGCGGPSSADCTGFAVTALAAVGALDRADLDGVRAYLASMQRVDGGFPAWDGSPGSTQSTAWALLAWWRLSEEPLDGAEAFLASMQRPDGSFACWSDGTPCGDPVGATAEAVLALTRAVPFPAYRDAKVVREVKADGASIFHLDDPAFDHVVWTIGDTVRTGATVRVPDPSLGVAVTATGPGIIHREVVVAPEPVAPEPGPGPFLVVGLLIGLGVTALWARRVG